MSMEKKGGEMRLPPGFRFHPTDEELVIQYLKRKVFSSPLPASIIPDFDHLSNSDPWDLPGDLEQERYFFCTKEAKYPNGKRWNRATDSGYWKATGLDKQIVSSKGNVIVGMKKTLVFYRGKPPHGSRTDWIMHEYRLLLPSSSHHLHPNNWVLCRIFFKRRGTNGTNGTIARNAPPPTLKGTLLFYDFLAQNNKNKSDSTSSTTSGITHDHEEDSTSSNTFPYFGTKP